MNATADSDLFEERYEPGFAQSVALAFAVHVVIAAVLFFGVRWQNRLPDTISVELWTPPPAPVVEQIEPPKPPPKVEPTPPPKPEPVIEKPDIVVKEPPKPKPEPVKKVEPKPEPPKPKPVVTPRVDPMQALIREQLAREQLTIAREAERTQFQDQLRREAAARDARALAGWTAKVIAKVRGNMVTLPDVKGNPEAIFNVVQLPTGEVLSAQLRKSSGHRALDDAIERAILKSSPLPRPDRPELFTREFQLRYRPRDD